MIELTLEQQDQVTLENLKAALRVMKISQHVLPSGKLYISKKDLKAIKRMIKYYSAP